MPLLLALLPAAFATPDACTLHATPAATLDVATLNTWGLPRPFANDRRGRFPGISEFLEDSAFDLVGLQEVWDGARPLLQIPDLYLPNMGRGDSGLALATGLPLSGMQTLTFSGGSGTDRLKKKGVLSAVVEVPGAGSIQVLVTHLQSGDAPREARARSEQITELLTLLESGPAVVMGDFNLYAENPIDIETVALLEGAGLWDAAARVGVTDPTHPGEGERLDRIYARGADGVCLEPTAARVIDYGDVALSDHLPVQVRLQVHGAL